MEPEVMAVISKARCQTTKQSPMNARIPSTHRKNLRHGDREAEAGAGGLPLPLSSAALPLAGDYLRHPPPWQPAAWSGSNLKPPEPAGVHCAPAARCNSADRGL